MDSETSAGTAAMDLMTEALLTLDESNLPADIGAHLDLAIVRLREHLEGARNNPTVASCGLG